jgi:hypothetical protein
MGTETKVAVRITRAFLPYMKDEIAWFDELTAAAYCKQGFAEPAPEVEFVPFDPPKALVVA